MSARGPWFLPHHPDVLGLLRHQTDATLDGLGAFQDWSRSGAEEDANRVRTAEHDGDDARHELLQALTVSLTTPIDQEHAYALSERIDEVLDRAKDTVRTAQALQWKPDAYAAEMGTRIFEAACHLRNAIGKLGERRAHPGADAELAIKRARWVEKDLRAGLAALPRDGAAWELASTLEVYRCYSAVGEALLRVADRTWYAALKVL